MKKANSEDNMHIHILKAAYINNLKKTNKLCILYKMHKARKGALWLNLKFAARITMRIMLIVA